MRSAGVVALLPRAELLRWVDAREVYGLEDGEPWKLRCPRCPEGTPPSITVPDPDALNAPYFCGVCPPPHGSGTVIEWYAESRGLNVHDAMRDLQDRYHRPGEREPRGLRPQRPDGGEPSPGYLGFFERHGFRPTSSPNGEGWIRGHCPFHDDESPSFSVNARTGRWRCFTECEGSGGPHKGKTWGPVDFADLRGLPISSIPGAYASYDYLDEEGRLCYQVVRVPSKGDPTKKEYMPRRPTEEGGWEWGFGKGKAKVKRLPYRLPELLAAGDGVVYHCEGERDADNLAEAFGVTATTSAGGAKGWGLQAKALAPHYSGRAVVVLPDNDREGREYAADVARSLHGTAASVRVLALPGLAEKGADVTDWLEAGGALEDLERLAAEAPEWEPSEEEQVRRSAADYESAPGTFHRTDLGNAELLTNLYGDRIRYVHPWRRWLIWDGRRWAQDPGGGIDRLASLAVRERLRRAADLEDESERKAEAKWAFASEAAARKAGALDWARSQPGVPVQPKDLDADKWLLNVQNGTLNLRAGELKPHDPADLITKIAPVEYHSDATSPLWEDFLNTATGSDEELRGFLQRAVGYTLTGDTGEEVLFFVHGPEATGKSTFMEAVKATLGEYAMTADFEAFLKRRGDAGIRNDIARLAGARLVVSIEVDEGKRLAEGLVKQLTGGDTVTARFLNREFFEYVPQFKLWLAANKRPGVSATDGAMWRRILLVPFNEGIPKDERDPAFKAQLRDPAESGAAILAWAVQGCLAWQRDGLQVPGRVLRATGAYRREEDTLAEFLAEHFIEDPEAHVTADDIYVRFKDWTERNGEKPRGKTWLGRRLGERGFRAGHADKMRVRRGLALRPIEGPPTGDEPDGEDDEDVPF